MDKEPHDRLTELCGMPKVSPQFPFAPGALIRFHIPDCIGARGYINDDGMLVIVGAEKEEDDG